MKKPRVITNCVANRYAQPGERIIEFSFPNGKGGLISFYQSPAGPGALVAVYRRDKGVKVLVGRAGQ